jgi:hypothetical protein
MIVVQRSRLFLGPFHEESAYKRVGSMTCADRIVLMQTVQNISCFFCAHIVRGNCLPDCIMDWRMASNTTCFPDTCFRRNPWL